MNKFIFIKMRPFQLLPILLLMLIGCASKKTTNVNYLSSQAEKRITELKKPSLNIFSPRQKTDDLKDVLIFVYGGDWNSGKKGLYGFFGRNFAKKGVVTVIPDYTKSPDANYDIMAKQIADAITWVKNNIEAYGGNPNRIFITGHSAGGHLAALATMNPKYLGDENPVKGMIFNDAAGLDMHHYLQNNPPEASNDYITTWTTNPETWKDASPIYFIDENTPPLKIYNGQKTYPSIKTANQRFLRALKDDQPDVEPILLNKKHTSMILQYIWPWSDRYDEVISFMKGVK